MSDLPIKSIIKHIWTNIECQENVESKLNDIKITNTTELYLGLDYINQFLDEKQVKKIHNDNLSKIEDYIKTNMSIDTFKLLYFIKNNWDNIDDRQKIYLKLKKIDIECFSQLKNNVEKINDILSKNNYRKFHTSTINKIKVFQY